MAQLTRYSFGATSAIVTSLAFIVGLSRNANPRPTIIGSLLVIAVADNISDSLGIHVYQESQLLNYKVIRISTFFNFFTRFLVMLIFMLLVAFFQIHYAVIFSIIYGITLLSVMSYLIAKEQKANPYRAILQHVTITAVVVLISNFLGKWIMNIFGKT